jgi:hypothetical protein
LLESSELTAGQVCKSHWRRGQACEALDKFDEAARDFRMLLSLPSYDGSKSELWKRINTLDYRIATKDKPTTSESLLALGDGSNIPTIERDMKFYMADNIVESTSRFTADNVDSSKLLNEVYESCASEPYFIDRLMETSTLPPSFTPSINLVKQILSCEYTRHEYAGILLGKPWCMDFTRLIMETSVLIDMFRQTCPSLKGINLHSN